MDIGERIRHFRTQKGITVNKLANLAGISQSYLRDLELGTKQPTIEYLSYICDALGIDLVTFFDESKAGDELYALIRALSPEEQRTLIAFIKTVVKER